MELQQESAEAIERRNLRFERTKPGSFREFRHGDSMMTTFSVVVAMAEIAVADGNAHFNMDGAVHIVGKEMSISSSTMKKHQPAAVSLQLA
ncbi:hypothetical protein niasHT_025652 [Heterodera trifolii]|uniref:Uncharacterized protein n=1 Tax=Heterodera trifolii TaxID=157864 RepID=A0ABD2KHR7_9BILA